MASWHVNIGTHVQSLVLNERKQALAQNDVGKPQRALCPRLTSVDSPYYLFELFVRPIHEPPVADHFFASPIVSHTPQRCHRRLDFAASLAPSRR